MTDDDGSGATGTGADEVGSFSVSISILGLDFITHTRSIDADDNPDDKATVTLEFTLHN